MLTNLNLAAVLVAGLVSFFLGALWYMPLFGKLWIKLHGWTEEQVKAKQAKMNPGVFFGGMIVSYLLAAFAMAAVLKLCQVTQWHDGLAVAGLVWLVVAACAMTAHLASERHIGLYAIDAGFYLVFLIFQGLLLTLWP